MGDGDEGRPLARQSQDAICALTEMALTPPLQSHTSRSPRAAETNARSLPRGGLRRRPFALPQGAIAEDTVPVSLLHIFRALVATSLLLEVFTRAMVL